MPIIVSVRWKRVTNGDPEEMERTVLELRGVSCLSIDEVAPPKHQIVSSRSFGQPLAMKRQRKSPSYTTDWGELIRVASG